MTHVLYVLAISAGAITGWELVRQRWWERRKGTNRRASDPADPNAEAIPE